MTTSTTKAPSLEVHILGAGKGESIILKLPNDQWGVVDCYASSSSDPATNPTIKFLRNQGVKRLQFVCLSHPHDDHFLGMTKLIDEFKPREFWRAGCLSPEHVKLLAKYYRVAGISEGVDSFTRSAQELLGVYARVRAGVVNCEIDVIRAQSRMTLYPTPAEQNSAFRIEWRLPSGNQVELYEGAVWSCIGPDGHIAENLTRSHHNNISLVLRVVYGESSVLLGGDLEKEGWAQVVKEYGGDQLSASAIKVSHHGSPNGYCDGLWEQFASGGKPYAVNMPSRPHKLPKPKALKHIGEYSRGVYATCHFEGGVVASPAPTSEPSLDSRLAMRDTFATTPKVGVNSECGCCTITFNDKGQCSLVAEPPAHQLLTASA